MPVSPPGSLSSEQAPDPLAEAPVGLPFGERDVVIVGGGQSGLAVAYHLARELRRLDATFAVLDNREAPGGAWREGWDSLRLFSPAEWSSLPGYLFPRHLATKDAPPPEYPHRDDVVDYLAAYEARYEFPVVRPVCVQDVQREGERLRLVTDRGDVRARAVVAATGTAARPWIPDVPGRGSFGGRQLHSSAYRSPEPFAGQRVLVVGGGNSGAQILAELSRIADASWVVEHEPRFLPADVDGRVLFDAATARYHAQQRGEPDARPYGLADVVQVPPVRDALEAGRLQDLRPPISRLTPTGVVWPDGREEPVDAIVWCTGFRPALGFLKGLGLGTDRVNVTGTRSVAEPQLWLVGYGSWTGFASATLIGVGRSARATAKEVADSLRASI
ncbi:MAG TPA: NAD(P)/FAD-dependent oxidoreductase [Bacteroidetes bacterium]|nr:NAD(P)/FAD-dependent oxidoreductase [Bacteroidota bacterium]HIL58350.1 NAD(P)/FAD-dependent oxidoreductase [Rhodothermales bacterium]